MNKAKLDTTDLRSKILKGIDLAIEKLIRKEQQEDGELIFSKNGQVVVVKAKELEAK